MSACRGQYREADENGPQQLLPQRSIVIAGRGRRRRSQRLCSTCQAKVIRETDSTMWVRLVSSEITIRRITSG
ncbi:hypothetical protein [Rhodopirellula bahusiensis]|uniref:hypothetical protein n=1 Tax=Rhodopirellula bahusiensis TaxID=2014065 RepID=UPI00117BD492|nr:hypothetical protein [Rhodopirellula bahusiensis]